MRVSLGSIGVQEPWKHFFVFVPGSDWSTSSVVLRSPSVQGLSDRMRDGVCGLPKGAWRNSSRNGQTSTALCPQDVNEVGGGACFNDARVQVEPV